MGLSFGSCSVQASDRTDSSLGTSILARAFMARVFMQKKESSSCVSYCPPELMRSEKKPSFRFLGEDQKVGLNRHCVGGGLEMAGLNDT